MYSWGEGAIGQRPHTLGWDHKGPYSRGKDEPVLLLLWDWRIPWLWTNQEEKKERKPLPERFNNEFIFNSHQTGWSKKSQALNFIKEGSLSTFKKLILSLGRHLHSGPKGVWCHWKNKFPMVIRSTQSKITKYLRKQAPQMRTSKKEQKLTAKYQII